MHREEMDVIRQLYRLFLAYERIEALAAAGRLPASEQAELVPVLGDLARDCWLTLFGAGIDTPAHRRFALGWCLRNAELLMKEQVLPVIAHQVVAAHIQRELVDLADTATGYDFSQEGPQTPAGTALRRVYLIQSLTILLARLAGGGQIPPRLQAHLTRHLVKRVKALFAQTLDTPDELAPERLPELSAVLASFRERGLLAAEVAARLERAAGEAAPPGEAEARPGGHVPMSGSVPALTSSAGLKRPAPAAGSDSAAGLKRPAPAPVSNPGSRAQDPLTGSGVRGMAPLSAPPELVNFAAAGELIRRLRRAPSLAPEDRDRLTKRVETEMEDLLEELGPRRLDRALAELGERLGIPVPPRARSDASSTNAGPKPVAIENPASRLLPAPKHAAEKADGQPRGPDSSDYQWAFDLIDDLRRENVEPEGSSGK